MAEEKQPETEEEQGPALPQALYDWLQALVMALVCIILVFTFVGRFIYVSGHSMEPTLYDKDMMIIQELGYTPKQGDVVVLTKPSEIADGPIVKRVIATEGQTVEIDYEASCVYVDGEKVDDSYLGEPMRQPGDPNMSITSVTVPDGCIFVMGDNRNHSNDSRDVRLGVIDERYVIGRAIFVVLPFEDFGAIE